MEMSFAVRSAVVEALNVRADSRRIRIVSRGVAVQCVVSASDHDTARVGLREDVTIIVIYVSNGAVLWIRGGCHATERVEHERSGLRILMNYAQVT